MIYLNCIFLLGKNSFLRKSANLRIYLQEKHSHYIQHKSPNTVQQNCSFTTFRQYIIVEREKYTIKPFENVQTHSNFIDSFIIKDIFKLFCKKLSSKSILLTQRSKLYLLEVKSKYAISEVQQIYLKPQNKKKEKIDIFMEYKKQIQHLFIITQKQIYELKLSQRCVKCKAHIAFRKILLKVKGNLRYFNEQQIPRVVFHYRANKEYVYTLIEGKQISKRFEYIQEVSFGLEYKEVLIIMFDIQKQQNQKMFNGYTAERRLKMARRTEEIQKKQIQIKKRYHTQIQPLLLQHYRKRLRSFIEKMNTNPVVINPQNLLPPIKELPHFTFRDATDWKSIGTHNALYQSRNNKNLYESKQQFQTCYTMDNQSRSVYKHEYRSRERGKQLQPPMRFKSVQKFVQTKKKKNNNTQQHMKQKVELTKKAETFLGLRDTSISMSNNLGSKNMDEEEIQFLLNRQKNDIEQQARRYEKMRQPDEKKLHFKKIADLALTENDEYQKKDLRQILRKSGYSKIKRINFVDIPQTDNFSVLVQKIANK